MIHWDTGVSVIDRVRNVGDEFRCAQVTAGDNSRKITRADPFLFCLTSDAARER